jgi:hypothetical protein
MTARWLVVLITAAALVVTPLVINARPASSSSVTAVDLAARIQASGGVGWSGLVESSGSMGVPDSDSFASLAQLLGEKNELRVWWRSADDWRVDRIRSTGETGLYRQGGTSVRWVFESQTATISPVSKVRLPDASDLLPPTLARAMLRGARPENLTRLATRRLVGVDAPGLRLVPTNEPTTVAQVNVWAEPATGLPLRVELYGVGEQRPIMTTTIRDADRSDPDPSTTRFLPAGSIDVEYTDSVDVAAAANAFAESDLPRTLGGLDSRSGADPGAVGVYGRGPTTLIAVPLRGQVARPLRDRLRSSATARESALGILAPVGLVGLLVTPGRSHSEGRGGGFLLAGTVTSETLERAAAELLAGS